MEKLSLQDLPKKYAAVSHCFRHEAGAGGASSKGLYRLHQFSKVEMGIFCLPQQSEELHEYLLEIQKYIYQSLGIPFRILDMASEELGASAFRKVSSTSVARLIALLKQIMSFLEMQYDIEAWMPGRVTGDGVKELGAYGEICSASNCTDYQARRLNMRFQDPATGENMFIHTLNGTACAVSHASGLN